MLSTRSRLARRIRRHVEEYTPDGTLGRMLLALTSGTVSVFSLVVSLAFVFTPVPISLLIVPIVGSFGLGTAVLTLLMLWPVYLSAIGKVESPTDYAENMHHASKRSSVESLGQQRTSKSGDEADDALAVLRNRYARGELSEQEFEGRLERLLTTESVEEARLNLESETGTNPQNNRSQPQRELDRE